MTQIFRTALSGLAAQGQRLATSAANVANLHSLGRHPDPTQASAEAYVPQRTALTAAGPGVRATPEAVSPAAVLVYQPDHPQADGEGLVAYPNLSLEREAVEQIAALRAFQANARVIAAADEMLGELLDIRS
jgi:flagellar basal-body rod protein FlgC